MNTLEKKQIQKYLEDKRLPLDLYMEIEDHIISQIEELENNGIGFQEAFLQVQSKWKKELSFQNFNLADIKAVPKIVERIRITYIKEVMPKILSVSILTVILLIIGANQLDEKSFNLLYCIIHWVYLGIFFIAYALSFKVLMQRLGYNKRPLNVYHKMVELAIGLSTFPIITMMNASKSSEMFYNIFYGQENHGLSNLIILTVPLYLSSTCLFSAFVFIKYKKEVAKMKLA